MTRLEAVDNDNMTMEQKQDLAYLKAKYDEIIDQEIKGHQIRTIRTAHIWKKQTQHRILL